ncbi:MAG TPA: mannitol dehydrogenase family protein [Propionibacteriaceae bacterium]|nr:mannitol dehydrogenase family protein [Propionibacteriaceae bacterium]
MNSDLPRLDRSLPGTPAAAPIRLVHIGLGNFHRAHQTWYTAHAPDADEWGYASFTGSSPRVADALKPQDGLYTLIVRSSDGDRLETIGSLSAVHAASEHATYLNYLAQPETAVVTATVTEAGYLRRPDGHLNTEDEVLAGDLAALRQDPRRLVRSLPARLLAGLLARRTSAAGALTIASCDNLPGNGEVTRSVVYDLAALVDESLMGWMDEHIEFASSMVDRITPAANDDDRSSVRDRCGYLDAAPVVTEPFSEWIVSGRFPAGRPRWEEAGATLVEDVEPFEQRKLWLLNGSHTLLAYAGSIRGHETIDQAISDSRCRSWVTDVWDEASRHLSLAPEEVNSYRQALLERFSNPRMRDYLARIAADGSQKLPVRTVPVVLAERQAGRLPRGGATCLAAWVLHLRGLGVAVRDPGAAVARAAANGKELADAVPAVLNTLQQGLGEDDELVALVVHQAADIQS